MADSGTPTNAKIEDGFEIVNTVEEGVKSECSGQEVDEDQTTTLDIIQTVDNTLNTTIDDINNAINQSISITDVNKTIDELQDKLKHVHLQLDNTSTNVTNELKVGVNSKMANQLKTLQKFLQGQFDEFQKENEELQNDIKDKLDKLQEKVQKLEKQMPVTLIDTRIHYDTSICTWKILGIKNKLELDEYEEESQLFQLNGYNFGIRIKMEVKENHVWFSPSFQEIKGNGQPEKVDILPQISYVLIDQIGTRNVTRTISFLSGIKLLNGHYYRSTRMARKMAILNSPYMLNNSIIVHTYVESPSTAKHIYSYNGTMVHEIDNYDIKRFRESLSVVYYQPGPYFYTNPTGYRMQTRMYLYGFDEFKGKGVSVQILFVTGEFSALPWPFDHKTTVVIFNQEHLSKRVVKEEIRINAEDKSYFIDIPQSDLESEIGYFKDDRLVYKVTVDCL